MGYLEIVGKDFKIDLRESIFFSASTGHEQSELPRLVSSPLLPKVDLQSLTNGL